MRYSPAVPPADPAPATPLSAWAGALAIAVLAFIAAWSISVQAGAPAAPSFVDFNRSRISALRDQDWPADAATVVILGSSVVKYATRPEPEFADAVSSRIGRAVRVLRIAGNWGTFSDYVPLVPDLVELKPDLVVLQRELLATDRPQGRSFLLWIEGARVQLGIESPLVTSAEDEAFVQFEHPCWMRGFGRQLDDHIRERDDWVAFRPEGPAAAAARRFVEELLATGADVALVEIPMRPDYDAQIRDARRAAATGPSFDTLLKRVQEWDLGPLDASLFCDLTHVTPAGQKVTSGWLESRVAEWLAQPAG